MNIFFYFFFYHMVKNDEDEGADVSGQMTHSTLSITQT